MGAGCVLKFQDCKLQGCRFVALGGSQIDLKRCTFSAGVPEMHHPRVPPPLRCAPMPEGRNGFGTPVQAPNHQPHAAQQHQHQHQLQQGPQVQHINIQAAAAAQAQHAQQQGGQQRQAQHAPHPIIVPSHSNGQHVHFCMPAPSPGEEVAIPDFTAIIPNTSSS
jgi:hypothetical protein